MKAPLRILIVDDEPLARASLRLLVRADDELRLVGECGSAEEALGLLPTAAPDLLFLDIRMARMSGLELLRALGPRTAYGVILVTAYDQYAVEAFSAAVLDYLLKPFDDERFRTALVRAKRALQERELAEMARRILAGKGAARPAVVVRDGGRTELIPEEEIDWIEAQDYYAELHAAGRRHLIRESLRQLEQRLDAMRFVRIHRKAIVNVTRVRRLERLSHGEATVVLVDGTALKMSRNFRDALHTRLGLP